MRVDTVAAVQGVYDARSSHNLREDEFIKEVIHVFHDISSPGPNGRRECDYETLLKRLGSIEAEAWKWSVLWRYLGKSISNGIGVAN